LVEQIKKGVGFEVLERVAQTLGYSSIEYSKLMNVPESSFYRRKKSGKLNVEESNNFYAITSVFQLAIRVLGDAKKAQTWLSRPARALGGVIPPDYMVTAPGRDALRTA